MLEVGSDHRGGPFWPKGEALLALVGEGVHLLLDDVGALPDAADEQLRSLEDRGPHFDIPGPPQDCARQILYALPSGRVPWQDVGRPSHTLQICHHQLQAFSYQPSAKDRLLMADG